MLMLRYIATNRRPSVCILREGVWLLLLLLLLLLVVMVCQLS